MDYIKVIKGRYRGYKVNDCVFPVIKPIKDGAKGQFVTVDGSDVLGPGFNKIRITLEEYEPVGDSMSVGGVNETVQKIEETDEQIITRIRDRFDILDEMTRATCSGHVRAMIVAGPPGVGKSYGVEAVLDEFSLLDDIGSNRRRYEVVKGAMTPIGLYRKLYKFANKGNVLVFDDCDSVLQDDLALNILKAALDSSDRRFIQWNAASSLLSQEGIPNRFEFCGSVVFITNLKFTHVRSPKLREHLNALMSRCHYLDLTLDTERERFLRLEQVAADGQLFRKHCFNNGEGRMVINYMKENEKRLQEISLRMAIKLADLVKMSPERWNIIAETTCMKRFV